jgi:hypothetical protein
MGGLSRKLGLYSAMSHGEATPHEKRGLAMIQRSKYARWRFAHAEIGHRTVSICHLNNIAMRLGRSLRWDPVREQIAGDYEANRLLRPVMRPPWSL